MQSQLANQDKFVFKMIDGLKINVVVGDSKMLMEKLINLYSKADRDSTTQLPNTEVCPVCPGKLKLTTPRDIFVHFNSDKHKEVESNLVQASEKSTTGSVASGV